MNEQDNPVVELHDLVKAFRRRDGSSLTAVSHVSLHIRAGETLALIGESGSGKSTTGRLILGLDKPDSGKVFFDGSELTAMSPASLRAIRSRLTVVFQEPFQSLNPRYRIGRIVAEPLTVSGTGTAAERLERAEAALARVGLPSSLMNRRPADLSGGQQQRVGIARAIVAGPRAIVLDEPTASLDRTIRRQVSAVLEQLQRDLGLAYLLITHDIGTVRRVAHRAAVMLRGEIVEAGPKSEVLNNPQNDYTKRLVNAELPLVVPGIRRGRERDEQKATENETERTAQ